MGMVWAGVRIVRQVSKSDQVAFRPWLICIVYFHDSVGMMVFAYDFDLESGDISNKRLLVDRRDSYGEPDGMVVEYGLESRIQSLFSADVNQLARTAIYGSPCILPGA